MDCDHEDSYPCGGHSKQLKECYSTQDVPVTGYADSTAALGANAPGYAPLEWTDERVAAMWEFYAATEPDGYFAARFGRVLVDRLRHRLPSEGLSADYGCGRGQLTEILAHERPVLAVDFAETLAETRAAVAKAALPHQVSYATPEDVGAHAGQVSALFFLETIEHLLPHWIAPSFENMRKLLRPGGIIVCSTPNEEEVSKAMVCCPATRTYFHKYQHMRVFSAKTLADFMEDQGFETINIGAHNLGMSTVYAATKQRLRHILGRAQYPHLVYVGRRC